VDPVRALTASVPAVGHPPAAPRFAVAPPPSPAATTRRHHSNADSVESCRQTAVGGSVGGSRSERRRPRQRSRRLRRRGGWCSRPWVACSSPAGRRGSVQRHVVASVGAQPPPLGRRPDGRCAPADACHPRSGSQRRTTPTRLPDDPSGTCASRPDAAVVRPDAPSALHATSARDPL
jgi:hypothetical protein